MKLYALAACAALTVTAAAEAEKPVLQPIEMSDPRCLEGGGRVIMTMQALHAAMASAFAQGFKEGQGSVGRTL